MAMVQGGGGNGSVKSSDGKTMWIKASGYRMAEVSSERGFARVSVQAMNEITRSPELAAMTTERAHVECVRLTNALADGGPRPSMETGFHALMGRVTLHTHCVPINAFACCESGRELLQSAIDEPFLWVPYITPGYVLSNAIDALLEQASEARAIVLANHGFIATGGTVEEVLDTTARFVAASSRAFGPVPADLAEKEDPSRELAVYAASLQDAARRRGSEVSMRATNTAILRRAASQPEETLLGPPIIPDDAIYTGLNVHHINDSVDPESVFDQSGMGGQARFVVVLRGVGVIIAGPERGLSAMEESLSAHAAVRDLVSRHGACSAIPDRESRYLLSMESEQYRQAVSARAGPP